MAYYDVPAMSSPPGSRGAERRPVSPLSVRVVEEAGVLPISPGIRVGEYIDNDANRPGGRPIDPRDYSPAFRFTDGEDMCTNSPVVTTLGPAPEDARPPFRSSYRQAHRLAEGSLVSDTISEIESKGGTGNGNGHGGGHENGYSHGPAGHTNGKSSPPHVELAYAPAPGTYVPQQSVTYPPQTHLGKVQGPASPSSADLESGKGRSLTVYPQYLGTVGGIFKLIELVIAILICATVDASQCAANAVCGTPSGPIWRYILGGQGFVLFVAIMFIFGNLAFILLHIFKVPSPISKLRNRLHQGEFLYNIAGAVLFIIAGCVEAWYASWTMLDVQPHQNFLLLANQIVPNPFRPQWIAAAIFTWINAIIFAGNAVYSHTFEKE